jgi:hypothetical protein
MTEDSRTSPLLMTMSVPRPSPSPPPRVSLSDRLQRLARTSAPAPGRPNAPNAPDMRAAAHAARASAAAAVRPPQAAALPEPVLRWLDGGKSTLRYEPEASGSSARSAPPSDLSALDEALRDDLVRPERTSPHRPRPPEHFRPSRAMTRAPSLLDSLARSALPTASLSQPDLPSRPIGGGSVPPSPPRFFPRQPYRCGSSVDTLRSLQSRSLHASAVPQLEGSPPSNRWWLPSFSKSNVDPLLDEEDRKSEPGEEQDHIRRKCMLCSLYIHRPQI